MKIKSYKIVDCIMNKKTLFRLENEKGLGFMKSVDEKSKRKIKWGTHVEIPVGEPFCLDHPLFREHVFCLVSYSPKQKTVSLLDVIFGKHV